MRHTRIYCIRVCAYMHTCMCVYAYAYIRVLGWCALRIYFGSDISELHFIACILPMSFENCNPCSLCLKHKFPNTVILPLVFACVSSSAANSSFAGSPSMSFKTLSSTASQPESKLSVHTFLRTCGIVRVKKFLIPVRIEIKYKHLNHCKWHC